MSLRKPREYGTAKEAIGRAVDEVGGLKAARAVLGEDSVSLALVHKYTDDAADEQISFARAAQLVIAGARAPVEHLAHVAGGVFVDLNVAAGDLPKDVAGVAREFGEFMAEYVDDIRDGTLTPAEARRIAKEADDLQRVLARVRARVMSYGPSRGTEPCRGKVNLRLLGLPARSSRRT